MPSRRMLAACLLLLLPAATAQADWHDDAGLNPHMLLPPAPLPATRNAAPIAAAACYAPPVSCTMMLPRRPGTPCHCRTRSGVYWGNAR